MNESIFIPGFYERHPYLNAMRNAIGSVGRKALHLHNLVNENIVDSELFQVADSVIQSSRFKQEVDKYISGKKVASYDFAEKKVYESFNALESRVQGNESLGLTWMLGGQLAGRVYGAYFVWMFHQEGLHEMGVDNVNPLRPKEDDNNPLQSHWKHHSRSRKYGFYDPYHIRPSDEKNSQRHGENQLMAAIAAVHSPSAIINPALLGGVMQELWSFMYMHPRLHTDFIYALTNSEVHLDHHLPKHHKKEWKGREIRDNDLNYGVWRENIDNLMGTRWFYWKELDMPKREEHMQTFVKSMNNMNLNPHGPMMLVQSMRRWVTPLREDRLFMNAEKEGDLILEMGLEERPHLRRLLDKFDQYEDPIRDDLLYDCMRYVDIVESETHIDFARERDAISQYVEERQDTLRKKKVARDARLSLKQKDRIRRLPKKRP